MQDTKLLTDKQALGVLQLGLLSVIQEAEVSEEQLKKLENILEQAESSVSGIDTDEGDSIAIDRCIFALQVLQEWYEEYNALERGE